MTKIYATDSLKEGREQKVSLKVEDNNSNDKDNVVALQLDDYGEKDKERVVDTRDNWMARFLYGGPIGLTLNFTLLTAITLHFVLTIGAKFEDEYFYEEIFKKIWLRQFWQICFLLLPLTIINTALGVFVIFPLSRLSRSTFYYWFLGVTASSFMYALLFANRFIGIEMMYVVRTIAGVEWLRMSMKMTSFLVECRRSKEVFDKSSIKTLLYFIFIPNLVYKHEYPRARRIRWTKVLSHIWWLWVVLMPVQAIILPLIPYVLMDITQVPLIVALVLSLASIFVGVIGFMMLNQFTIFENYCGLHGELLRYPDLKTFGSLKKTLQGARAPYQINMIVSRWLRVYVFSPVHKVTGSLFASVFCTFTVSYFFHDVVFIYMYGVSFIHIAIVTAMTQSLLMGCRASNKFLQVLHALLFYVASIIWCSSYFIEYLARNCSSIPAAEKEPIFALVPLSITVIFKRIATEVFS